MTKLSICVVLVLMAHSFAQSTRPKITAIDHVDFYTTSPDANQKLYATVLGLATAQPVESGQKQRYLVGSQWVGYSAAPDANPTNRLDHVAFRTEDADGLRKYLAAKGVKTPNSVDKWKDGTVSFMVKDPEGNSIEFVQPAKSPVPTTGNADPVSRRMIHAGFIVHDRAAQDRFYRDILGLPRDCVRTEVGSPFAPEQLSVRVVSSISTRFRHRSRSVEPLADLIARQYREQPGNYLAFLSSFEYLEAVAAELSRRDTEIPIWRQGPGMTEAQREEFLTRFAEHSCGIGFAVLGGAFAEGIDLPGRRLIGAFVATLGLPQLNPVNGEMRGRLEERFGAGYEYTYLYPGLRKVVQAAGRVIRGSEDRGVVYLIDDRFARHEVRRLLPRWWRLC